MKNIMKKLTAAILALSCLPAAALTASAEDLSWYWGAVKWEAFEGKTPVNHRGMFGDVQVVFDKDEGDRGSVILAEPRQNCIRIVLRDDVDTKEALAQIATILDAYFPGMAKNYNENQTSVAADPDIGAVLYPADLECAGDDRAFDLRVTNQPEDADAVESDLLLALARSHLISGFYGWGETASFRKLFIYDLLENIPQESVSDWDAVQAYLDGHYHGYQIEQYESEPYVVYSVVSGDDFEYYEETATDPLCRIVPNEELTFLGKLELACELWAEFKGDYYEGMMLESDNPIINGHNALAKTGDVTLDTDLGITDVIALNRNIMTGDPLCDTAKKNADINGNGVPDEADALAILKEVVEITKDFQPQ